MEGSQACSWGPVSVGFQTITCKHCWVGEGRREEEKDLPLHLSSLFIHFLHWVLFLLHQRKSSSACIIYSDFLLNYKFQKRKKEKDKMGNLLGYCLETGSYYNDSIKEGYWTDFGRPGILFL